VTNTGNVTLNGISLSDDNDNDNMVCRGHDAGGGRAHALHGDAHLQPGRTGCERLADGGQRGAVQRVTAISDEAPDATDNLSIPITQNAAMTVRRAR